MAPQDMVFLGPRLFSCDVSLLCPLSLGCGILPACALCFGAFCLKPLQLILLGLSLHRELLLIICELKTQSSGL